MSGGKTKRSRKELRLSRKKNQELKKKITLKKFNLNLDLFSNSKTRYISYNFRKKLNLKKLRYKFITKKNSMKR